MCIIPDHEQPLSMIMRRYLADLTSQPVLLSIKVVAQ